MLAKAQAWKRTSDGEIRTARSGAPPGSTRSKVRVRSSDFPAAMRDPNRSRRRTPLSVRDDSDTVGEPVAAVRTKLDVPGRTDR